MADVDLQDYFDRMQGRIKRFHGAAVWLSYELEKDEKLSLEEGRPRYKEKLMLNVQFPGADHTVREAEERDKFEYPDLFKEHEAREGEPTEGTHLKEWTLISRSVIEELKYFGIKTVEQLATYQIKEDPRERFIEPWQKRAREYIKASKDAKNKVVALTEINEKLEARTKKLEEQILLLHQRIEQAEGVRLSGGVSGFNI